MQFGQNAWFVNNWPQMPHSASTLWKTCELNVKLSQELELDLRIGENKQIGENGVCDGNYWYCKGVGFSVVLVKEVECSQCLWLILSRKIQTKMGMKNFERDTSEFGVLLGEPKRTVIGWAISEASGSAEVKRVVCLFVCLFVCLCTR